MWTRLHHQLLFSSLLLTISVTLLLGLALDFQCTVLKLDQLLHHISPCLLIHCLPL